MIADNHIDFLVDNAGYSIVGAAEEFKDEDILHQIDTNLISSIRTIRAFLPYFRHQGGGRIVQVSSEGGQVTYPGFSVYHASKWGIEGFIESVAQEVAPFNISFAIAEPGPTSTQFAANAKTASLMQEYAETPADVVREKIKNADFDELDTPEYVAQRIIEMVNSEDLPNRFAIGKVAYHNLEQTLENRLNTVKQLGY
ncbi:SDR family NAD(P)-dependent oxidoreductase [Echinicola vietnamensis]|uniref:SDR family NAD(P)-dependent oxidoreductase n=1 Tax=Echinicola vietnamensis TaxID=390884 RepID=UPI0002F36400|nr:SDR family NAD(P)-dependent oxidoreductase [Echinicola vietnamensis]